MTMFYSLIQDSLTRLFTPRKRNYFPLTFPGLENGWQGKEKAAVKELILFLPVKPVNYVSFCLTYLFSCLANCFLLNLFSSFFLPSPESEPESTLIYLSETRGTSSDCPLEGTSTDLPKSLKGKQMTVLTVCGFTLVFRD